MKGVKSSWKHCFPIIIKYLFKKTSSELLDKHKSEILNHLQKLFKFKLYLNLNKMFPRMGQF